MDESLQFERFFQSEQPDMNDEPVVQDEEIDEQMQENDEYIAYKDSTYEIVSIVAYLIGVNTSIFTNEHEPPKMEVYNRLNQEKPARIVRNLCILRTAIERNFKYINDKMQNEYRSLFTLPEYVPQQSLNQLYDDGVNLIKNSHKKLTDYIIEINSVLSNRLINCQQFFPTWLNWDYIREMFIMPNGLKESGTKEAADIYYANKAFYPYQVYINWRPEDVGNLLYNDKKFVTKLYEWHRDRFTEYSKVSDAGDYVKNNIYDYINDSKKVVVAVDCENSDPYKLCATLKGLDYEYTQKISRIILFDDVHTASGWGILERYTQIPVEYILIERLKENKSLVDMKLAMRVCKEYYENEVDSFIIVSSDSDFWGLISSLPKAHFLVMVERTKCGPDIKNALISNGIFYCFIDDFYTGDTEELKINALLKEMRQYIDSCVSLNVNKMLDQALWQTRVQMTPAEKKQFYQKYIKTMQMSINKDGDVCIEIRMK